MPKVEFNINNYVEFELTEAGVEAMYAADEPYRGYKWFVEKEYFVGQVVRMQMWGMISKFGERTKLGKQTFCNNAIITLEIKQG